MTLAAEISDTKTLSRHTARLQNKKNKTPEFERLSTMKTRFLTTCLALSALLVTSTSVFADHQGAGGGREIIIMSRNLYVGFDEAVAVVGVVSGIPAQIIQSVTTAYAQVLANQFPKRAEALADEIAQTQPLLIGVQEAALFRTGPFDSFSPSPTPAVQVEFDYLALLLQALAARGLDYEAVVINEVLDAEFPGVTPAGLRDVRITDRDVILARAGLAAAELKLSNPQSGTFVNNLTIPIGSTGLFFRSRRGWESVDAKVRGKTFRFISTHLEPESVNPAINTLQAAQAAEILAGPANTALAVIFVGDLNSRADGTGTPTYANVLAAGFTDVFTATNPAAIGDTCCHAAVLTDSDPTLDQGIDYVLIRGDLQPLVAEILGEEPADFAAYGIWPSDHAGVAASVDLHSRP
ncbi:MAG TPA: endonuclease/exonuclease/phosphatase family protein [Candidatus Binatia bacterium]|nr:endonuclease/exonuclease/phosphatase family protein [Candidatus Binatia bacterium]